MSDIPVNLVFEDSLSEAVLRKLLENSRQRYAIGLPYNSRGCGWIRARINALNNSAKGMPYLVLTDLDVYQCPPALIKAWFSTAKHHNLIFRIAVREVESWLLGCRPAFAKFLAIKENLIPTNVDELPDAKKSLIDLVRKSPKRQLRLDIVPEEGSTAKIGPDYNGRLIYFVEDFCDPKIAKEHSPSLQRTIKALDKFQPIFESSF
jgi:hypothetical protein